MHSAGSVRADPRRLTFENGWGARKIQGELSKLGFTISLATVSRYLPKRSPDPGQHQRWMTFLRNHQDAIAAMDFCIVPTLRFQLLYVWFVIDHGRRRLIHFNVTKHPSTRWAIQQLREAFPSERTPRYLILDRDSIFSAEVVAAIRSFGIDPVIVFGEPHLRRLLADGVAYYNGERVHTRLGDSPDGRPIEARPSPTARVVGLPRVGGLHHRYVWAKAA